MTLPSHIFMAVRFVNLAIDTFLIHFEHRRRDCSAPELEELDAIVAPVREAHRRMTELVRTRTGDVHNDGLIVDAMVELDGLIPAALAKFNNYQRKAN